MHSVAAETQGDTTMPSATQCQICGAPITQSAKGRRKRFCEPCQYRRHMARVYARRQREYAERERQQQPDPVRVERRVYQPRRPVRLYDGRGAFLGWRVWDGREWLREK